MCKEDIPDPTLPGGVPDDNQPVDGGVVVCVPANLHVRVVDASDPTTVIVGADVTVDGQGSKPTDASGWAKWRPIPPGTYRVDARKDVHTPDPVVEASVVVPACTTKEVTLQLQPVELHLHVDADRDGAVDADWTHNTPWTPGAGQHGAVMLFNNDNGDRDAAKQRDFENDNVDGAADLGDLAPLHIRRHPPGAALPPTVSAVLSVGDATKLRIVMPANAAGTEIVGPSNASHTFDNAALAASSDIALAMEGLQYADGGFDGKVDVVLDIQVGGATVRSERAQIRVAPWMVFNHAMLTEKAYIVRTGDNAALRRAINAELTAAGLPALKTAASSRYNGDRWMQDGMEPGFSAMPRAGGASPATPATLRTALDRNPGRQIDTYPKRELLDRGYGFHEALAPTTAGSSLDSFGNLECSPPFTHSGAGGEPAQFYPFGRAIFGGDTQGNGAPSRQMHPRVQALLRAQVVQAAFEIDTNWLVVGHVDEFISFLPGAGGSHGWKVLIASPSVAMSIVAAQPAATPLFVGINMATPDPFGGGRVGRNYRLRTCGALLGDADFPTWQIEAQAIIDNVRIAELKVKLDLQDSDFIHLPVLFDKRGSRYVAYTAGSVNMLVLSKGGSDNHLCIPKPFGPRTAAGCRFEDDIQTKLGPLVTSLRFIDDFFTYHVGQGEIHCGTNSQRTPPTDNWWELPWI